MKSFEANKDTKFSYVLSKDHTYMLTVCDKVAGKGGVAINLYDRNNKLILSSYNRSAKKYYSAVTYKCTATGVYHIEAVFGSSSGCGVSILGFKN